MITIEKRTDLEQYLNKDGNYSINDDVHFKCDIVIPSSLIVSGSIRAGQHIRAGGYIKGGRR